MGIMIIVLMMLMVVVVVMMMMMILLLQRFVVRMSVMTAVSIFLRLYCSMAETPSSMALLHLSHILSSEVVWLVNTRRPQSIDPLYGLRGHRSSSGTR